MSKLTLKSIQKEIAGWGWQVLGWVEQPDVVILLGNVGPLWWQVFSESPEFGDGRAHPMDRAAKRLGDGLATRWQCSVTYPSDGPPYPPFLAWARQSGQSHASMLGPMIHQRYGLWHAYRAALIFDGQGAVILPDETPARTEAVRHPCEQCRDKPCLSACPVHAIGQGRYDVPSCVAYLDARPDDCLAQGCAARRACPVGAEYYYSPSQAEFHMRAFFAAQSKKPD